MIVENYNYRAIKLNGMFSVAFGVTECIGDKGIGYFMEFQLWIDIDGNS